MKRKKELIWCNLTILLFVSEQTFSVPEETRCWGHEQWWIRGGHCVRQRTWGKHGGSSQSQCHDLVRIGDIQGWGISFIERKLCFNFFNLVKITSLIIPTAVGVKMNINIILFYWENSWELNHSFWNIMLQIYRIKLLKGNQCSKDLYNHNKVPAMKSHCRKTMLTPLKKYLSQNLMHW